MCELSEKKWKQIIDYIERFQQTKSKYGISPLSELGILNVQLTDDRQIRIKNQKDEFDISPGSFLLLINLIKSTYQGMGTA